LKYVNAKRYKWQEIGNDQLPSGELVIVKGFLRPNPAYRLAYRFEIAATEPLISQVVYVDAENGDVIHKESLVCNFHPNEPVHRAAIETPKDEICNTSILPFSNSPGTAESVYSGTVNIVGDSYSGGYRLNETTNGVSILTRKLISQTVLGVITWSDFSDNDNNWTTAEHSTNKDIYATDAHWGTERVYDYFLTQHIRNSIDNAGLPILCSVHQLGWDGFAGWASGDNYAFFGDDDATYKVMTALDVVAHEFGHGVTKFNRSNPSVAGLNHFGETGSINEGMSDLWSACIENFAMPNRPIWLIGDQIFKNSSITCERNMQNPKDPNCYFVMADCYGGTNWINPSTDPYNQTMWYRNLGVFTHWFYILSVGKTGTNDLNHSYQVPGIGITNAAKIIYRALTTYFTPSINFAGVRDATITSAIDLFGQNSCYVESVTNAWYAVGVGSAYSGNDFISILGDDYVCTTSNTYTISSLQTGLAVQWDASPSGIVTINSPNSQQTTLTKNDNGHITLTATVNTCSGGTITLSKNIIAGVPTTFTGLFGNYPQTPVVTTDDGSNDINSDEPTYVTFTSNEYIAPGQPSIQFSNMTLLQSSQNFPDGAYRWQYIKNSSYGELYLYMPQNSWAYFQYTLPNACGNGTFYLYFQAYQGAYYRISPNPTKDIVTVQVDEKMLIKNKAVKSTEQDIREIDIVDKMGNILQRKTFGQAVRIASLNIAALKPDIYLIRIFNGKTWTSVRLLKQ
jgi:Zn-dependent metalloprotease